MAGFGKGPRVVRRFHDLMPFRVREVLLVASPYDAFILEEDGLLTEQVFLEYRDLSLPASPRFTHVATGEEAIQKLIERRFDLILTMTRLSDMGVNAFGRRVKDLRPGRPVVLLALDPKETYDPGFQIDRRAIDAVFLWNGDARILLAVMKYVEDRDNVDHDIQKGNVRVIIMIEDSPRYYSSFLGMLYHELMEHARSLYREGLNELQRRMYMNSRPKILHATSYEEGLRLFEAYQRNVIAIISDVGILRRGDLDSEAGLDFVRFARSVDRELPVLLQSSNPDVREKAEELNAIFVDKSSPKLLAEIRNFLSTNLGFGDFVFRNADGEELARAHDIRELQQKLALVDEDSIRYHSKHNHFSMWLMARSEFDLAEELRPKRPEDFSGIESLRHHIIQVLRTAHESRRGAISDFSRAHFESDLMTRLGDGAMGGKARGIAFLYSRLADYAHELPEGLDVRFPKSTVIASEHFDAFLTKNDLGFVHTCDDDTEMDRRFLAARLPTSLESDLAFFLGVVDGPLAVRSSSMLEDSLHQPFAGIYTTLMIPNNAPDPHTRLRQLCAAIKLVYASTFHKNARSYLQSTGKLVEDEKMSVIIQRLVGRRLGERFYPSFAGVAESYNFYPIGAQKAEDGVVHLALGLGRFVVDGGAAMRFNPRMPGVLPPHTSIKGLLHNTQRTFYALDMSRECRELREDLMSTVHPFDLKAAEDDGSLAPVGSVYSADDRRVRDDLSLTGPRLVTFNNILRHKAIPLAETLSFILDVVEEGMGGPVELEFACDMGDWGKRVRRGKKKENPALYLLQLRPFAALAKRSGKAALQLAPEECICVSSRSLGHGIDQSISDIVYVALERWTAAANKAVAAQVAELNDALGKEGRPYLLIGPGRWGSADEWLGIPVKWSQISNVQVIVEASPAGYDVEPSQGTHFFQNITSLRLGYITLPPGAAKSTGSTDFLDWAWLDAQPAYRETAHLRHLRLQEPLTVVLNGPDGRGSIARPGVVPHDGSGNVPTPEALRGLPGRL